MDSGGEETATTVLRVGTFNVHGWADGSHKDNLERVVDLIGKQTPKLDVVCLQEASGLNDSVQFYKGSSRQGGVKSIFADVLGLKHCISWRNCAIFSRYKFTDVVFDAVSRKQPRVENALGPLEWSGNNAFVIGAIRPNATLPPIYITCLHLNHVAEPTRLSELSFITEKALHNLLPCSSGDGAETNSPATANHSGSDFKQSKWPMQIWTGDFNALTREDYSDSVWEDISNIRQVNSWESPQVKLTNKIKAEHGMVDCWELAGRPEPIKTCRFDTRIDYIYASPSVLDHWKLARVETIDDPTSDHNLVIATFQCQVNYV